jgi:mono/diheme cytochrome c family protein
MPAGEGRPARRLETRLLVVDRRGTGYGVTYRWRGDGSDAELLSEGLTETIQRGDRKQTWTYPGRGECLVCHTASAGFVLGVNTRQLNRPSTDPSATAIDNLLRTWNRQGLFRPAIRDEDVARLDRLVAVTDTNAALEHRVRSYLDANCAQCHRPGGARGDFDARFDTPLARQKLVNAPLLSSDLGVAGVKLVTPGDPERSMVYLRMKRRQDVFNMPPLATHEADSAALAVVRDWIKGLPPAGPGR